jgi:hypothetical protein
MPKVDESVIGRSEIDGLRSALINAREAGIAAIMADKTTSLTDDPDCYPRGLKLTIERSRPEWILLKALEKEFEWFSVNKRSGSFTINANLAIKHRLTLFGFQQAVANSLNESGIDCYAEVNWRD